MGRHRVSDVCVLRWRGGKTAENGGFLPSIFIKIEKYLLKLLQFVKICVIIYMYSGLDRAERLDRRLFSTGYVLDNF